MKINIQTIPNSEQRYITTGDYWIDSDGTWQIRVSDLGDWKKELLVAIHELAEQAICLSKGIKEEDISAFDIEFEKNRTEGNFDEPGDDRNAPYADEHCIATSIERLMSVSLGLKWKDYDDAVNNVK